MGETKKVTITMTPDEIRKGKELSKRMLNSDKENLSGLIRKLINMTYGKGPRKR